MSPIPVWFLAHPVAGDEQYSYIDNMGGMDERYDMATKGHVVKCLEMCYRAGFATIAPYHTLCLALDDNNSTDRALGQQTGLTIVRNLGRLILAGHKISRGMEAEVAACLDVGGDIYNLIGVPDKDFITALKLSRPQHRLRL